MAKKSKLHQRAPEFTVKVGGQVDEHLKPVSIDLTVGGHELDTAVLRWDPLGHFDKGVVKNLEFNQAGSAEVEITAKINDQTVPYFWGRIASRRVSLGEGGEELQYVCRLEYDHFGLPLIGATFANPASKIGANAGLDPVVELDIPAVFNPQVDGETRPNRSPTTVQQTGTVKVGTNHFWPFIDPAAIKYYNRLLQVGDAKWWTLAHAAHYLCSTLNRQQTDIRNPTFGEIKAVLDDDEDVLRNHPLRIGRYLPQLLDDLLEPYGFSWFVEHDAGRRKIKFYERNAGTPLSIAMQAVGEELDTFKTALESFDFSYDLTRRGFNRVTVLGDFERFEHTFPLVRGWDSQYDGKTSAELTKTAIAADPALENVWRTWVLNESGEYKQLSGGAPYDLTQLATASHWTRRRRRFLPCLTVGADGSPIGTHGVFLEYLDAGGSWQPVHKLNGGSFELLEHECGIRFTGNTPPVQLMERGAAAAVRVTATIASDWRIKATVSSQNTVIPGRREEVLDLSDRYKYRARHLNSKFAQTNQAAAEQDDRGKLAKQANVLLGAWDQATLIGSVSVEGVKLEPKKHLGRPVKQILGRKIGLDTRGPGHPDPRYPAIVGARYLIDEQRTVLQLDVPQVSTRYRRRAKRRVRQAARNARRTP